MLSQEEQLKVFWASSPQNIRRIPTFEFSHSDAPQIIRIWRETYNGTVKDELNADILMTSVAFKDDIVTSEDNLEQKYVLLVDLTDSQDLFREILDAIPINTTEAILVKCREYLSNNLNVIQASIDLIVEKIDFTQEGTKITCITPRTNLTTTGDIYTPLEVPMLRGYL